MSVLRRISNIFKSKVNTAIDSIENPVELLDQKIRDMEESLNKAKISSAQILGNVHSIERKMEDCQKLSKDFDDKVKLALSKNNEDLAKRALEKKLEQDKTYESLKASYKEAYEKSEKIKKNLYELEEELKNIRIYREEAAARFNNAEASQRINVILADIQTNNNKISLQDIERKIQRKEALAEGFIELKADDSLDKEFEELEKPDLDAELEKYKNSTV